jgi:UDP:flavonoid glycosyltransferase YjiC (YdhE family)
VVVPKPSDWGDWVEVTGYWFLDSPTVYSAPPALELFLAAGEPPIVVGFGSHVARNPARLTEMVLEALALTGRRGILLTGWGGLRDVCLPKEVLAAADIPHDWLLPRALALVHHGGSGTTAIALKVGLPQVIVPFGWDQAFWAHRTAKLGVSSQPIPLAALTARQLAAAINEVTTQEDVRQRARQVGELIRSERGVEAGVTAIERFARQAKGRGVAPGSQD